MSQESNADSQPHLGSEIENVQEAENVKTLPADTTNTLSSSLENVEASTSSVDADPENALAIAIKNTKELKFTDYEDLPCMFEQFADYHIVNAGEETKPKVLIIKYDNHKDTGTSFEEVITIEHDKPVDFSNYVEDDLIDESKLAQALTRLFYTDTSMISSGKIETKKRLPQSENKTDTADTDSDDVTVTIDIAPTQSYSSFMPPSSTSANYDSWVDIPTSFFSTLTLENTTGESSEDLEQSTDTKSGKSLKLNPEAPEFIPPLNPNAPEFIPQLNLAPGFIPQQHPAPRLIWQLNPALRFIPQLNAAPRFIPQLSLAPGFVPQLNLAPGFVPQLNLAPGFVPQLNLAPGFVPQLNLAPVFFPQLNLTSEFILRLSPAPEFILQLNPGPEFIIQLNPDAPEFVPGNYHPSSP